MNKPSVMIIALGGTISMKTSTHGGVIPTLTVEDFIKENPGLSKTANLKGIQFKQTASPGITLNDLLYLAAYINHCDADGIVVVQGTDTIEESAFGLQCLCDKTEKAIVLTGAMRNPSEISSDSLLNLQNAVRVASDERAKKLDVLVATGYAIYSAIHVAKWNTVNVQAFGSDKGIVGWIVEERFHLANYPVVPSFLKKSDIDALLSQYKSTDNTIKLLDDEYIATHITVPIYKVAMDDNGEFLKALIASKPKGMVLEGMGGGHVPAPLVENLKIAAQNIPIILCSRSAFGEVLTMTYGYKGSEIDLINAGLIPAAWLPSLKARILLMLILMIKPDAFQTNIIQDIFAEIYLG